MKFETRWTDKTTRAFEALEFLRVAYKGGKLSEIENMEEVIEAIDIVQDLEYAYSVLESYHINL